MNERTIAAAEQALENFLKKTRRESDYYRGRLIKAEKLPAPDKQMVSAAVNKVNWYAVEIYGLEGELEMLREELGIIKGIIEQGADQEDILKEEPGGEEEKNTEYDAGRA